MSFRLVLVLAVRCCHHGVAPPGTRLVRTSGRPRLLLEEDHLRGTSHQYIAARMQACPGGQGHQRRHEPSRAGLQPVAPAGLHSRLAGPADGDRAAPGLALSRPRPADSTRHRGACRAPGIHRCRLGSPPTTHAQADRRRSAVADGPLVAETFRKISRCALLPPGRREVPKLRSGTSIRALPARITNRVGLWVPIIHPCWSGSMPVFLEDCLSPPSNRCSGTRSSS
jgi:hypothetical protein